MRHYRIVSILVSALSLLLLASGCNSGSQDELVKVRSELEATRAQLEKMKKSNAEIRTGGRPGGNFDSSAGETGFQAFGRRYGTPPRVSLASATDLGEEKHTIITEITQEGFKWKNVAPPRQNPVFAKLYWTAEGVGE